jgi:hypothetical protein
MMPKTNQIMASPCVCGAPMTSLLMGRATVAGPPLESTRLITKASGKRPSAKDVVLVPLVMITCASCAQVRFYSEELLREIAGRPDPADSPLPAAGGGDGN